MAKWRSGGALATLLATLAGALAAGSRLNGGAVPLTHERIEADLCVRVEQYGKADPLTGVPRLGAILVNASPLRHYHVVAPGDGSEVGWREPHVYWTATVDRGSGPEPVPESDRGRCGLFDGNWPRDAVALAPGGEVSLGQLDGQLEFQRAGRAMVTAHYEYNAGDRRRLLSVAANRIGLMAGVPAFHLASAPFAFQVRRPLDVRLTVKGACRAGQTFLMSELFAVALVNRSDRPMECYSPSQSGEARLQFEAQWPDSLGQTWEGLGGIDRDDSAGVARTLRPGESVELLGPGEFSNGLDGPWEWPAPGAYRVRAGYRPAVPGMGPPVYSEWVEVRVE